MKTHFFGDIDSVEWTRLVNENLTYEEQWNTSSAQITHILDQHAPTKRFQVRQPYHPPVSDGVIEQMHRGRVA